jgi:hypothetical protein
MQNRLERSLSVSEEASAARVPLDTSEELTEALSALQRHREMLYSEPLADVGEEVTSRRGRDNRADRIHPMKAARLEREERRRAGMARRSGDNHYKRRLKRRREKYHRVERKFKLKRDEWMKTTAEGLWFDYKNRWKRKSVEYTITQDEFVALMYTMIDSRYIYEYIFSIYRVDTSKPISTSNITIVDRYSNIVLYSSI